MKMFCYNVLVFVLFPLFVAGQDMPVVTSALQEAMEAKGDDAFVSVNIRLAAQYDQERLYAESRSLPSGEKRRTFVVNTLKEFTGEHQSDLLSYLREREAAGKAKKIRPLWIGNLVNAKVKPAVVFELSARKDLAQLDYNQERLPLMTDPENRLSAEAPPDALRYDDIAWNVTHINADRVWEQGFTGEGVVVAVMDTGVNFNHLDIKDNMWEHPDYPNHGYNFFHNNHNTMDVNGHGTHCAGTVAGTGVAGTATGMAPGATIMSLRVLGAAGEGTEAAVWAGIEFAVEYGADVMSISLGWLAEWNPDRSMWRTAMNNALSAGVIAVVATGNEGHLGPPTGVRTPADVPPPWLHPDQTLEGGRSAVLAVGSTTDSDMLSGFSSKGPVTWQNVEPFNDYPYNPGMGLIRPDVVAPGTGILSLGHQSNTAYVVMSGTSMATPAVAGLAALVISKYPGVSPEEITRILEESAIHFGPEGKNNLFGSGRVDAELAILATPNQGVNYVSHLVNDIEGNQDGKVNPGELIELDLILENTTDDAIAGVESWLAVESPYVTLIDSVAHLGDFAGQEERAFEGLYRFRVADDAPGRHTIRFMMYVRSADDKETVWRIPFAETTYAPLLSFSGMEIEDAGSGNGEGEIGPGETVQTVMSIANRGQLESVPGEALLQSDSDWLNIVTYGKVEVPAIAPGDTTEVSFTINVFHNVPSETRATLDFTANIGYYEVTDTQHIVLAPVSPYSDGKIPSTFVEEEVATDSSAIEPGRMTVTIPEGSTITGVDVEYALASRLVTYMNEQRSFLRCVSEGGETESEVYFGEGNSVGTYEYERTGLDIASNVEGGGPIEFELHVFRTYGGSGSDTQYVYVPDETWRTIVHYTLPYYDVHFSLENQFGEIPEGAVVSVDGQSQEIDEEGEAVLELPGGIRYYNVFAPGHRPLRMQGFEVVPGDNLVEATMLRVFEAGFLVHDDNGNTVPDATITIDNEQYGPGEYVIGDLEPGTYGFAVEAEGHLPYEGEFSIVDADIDVEVALTPVYSVGFSIFDAWGDEVLHASITFGDETFPAGYYEISNVLQGTYPYAVSAEHYYDYSGEAEVVDGDVHIEVTLTPDGTSVGDVSGTTDVEVYPNPARHTVTIRSEEAFGAVNVVDLLGQVVYSGRADNRQYKLNVSALGNGIYFVQVHTAGGIATTRLQVIH